MPSKYYMSSCVTLHIDFTRTFFCSLGTGPQWYNKHKTRLLFASRRHDRSRARKYAGNIADGLRSSPWKRAQDPGKMTHRLFGTNNNAKDSVHLVHPSKIASLQPEKLAVHKILAFLGKKICCFVHDFHPHWIARLNLPLSDGLHNQLQPHQVDRILRRLVFPYHDTARLEKNRTKMLQIFIGLEIGQRDYMGKQIVYCKPFRDMENDAGRMDCVFFIPPPPYYTGSRRDFDLSLENAWYGRVSLLCSMKFRTDSGEVRDVDCAMMDVFFDYAEGRCFL